MYPYTLKEFCSIYENINKDQDQESNLKSEKIYRKMDLNNIEIGDFYSFCKNLLKEISKSKNTDGWYLGTLFPPFPDFDAMFFSKEKIIILELKHKIGTQNEKSVLNKFKKQNHLLKKLKNKLSNFDEKTEILYFLYINDSSTLLEYDLGNLTYSKVDFKYLANILNSVKKPLESNPIYELTRSDFLISPLNDFQSFKNGEYYLSDEQEYCEKQILQANGKGIFGVQGVAGSGKSLIAYDLLKKLKDKNILFIFPGNLREQHYNFQTNFDYIKFVSGKNLTAELLDAYEVVIVDEAQRLYFGNSDSALEILKSWIESNYQVKQIIFFYDAHQALGPKDCGNLLNNMLNTYCKDKKRKQYLLRESIRSNPEISAFVRRLSYLKNIPKKQITPELLKKHVEIKFFNEADEAKSWIQYKQNKNYTFLIPTGSRFLQASSDKFTDLSSISITTHEFLGEEQDKIITYIDDSFFYNKKGQLRVYNRTNYYFLDNELYVNLTRAREKLAIAIIGNFDIYLAIVRVIFDCK